MGPFPRHWPVGPTVARKRDWGGRGRGCQSGVIHDLFVECPRGLPSRHEAVRVCFKVTIITCGRERPPLLKNLLGRESRQMATGNLALGQEQGQLSARPRVTNDFSINVATVNGSGSQSANSVLLKSIFGMGVPVSGKNLFPSNIAGLPTWYTIRASKDGYVARKRESEVLVALNPDTATRRCAGTAGGRRGDLRRKARSEAIPRRCGVLPGAVRQDYGGDLS